MADEFKTTPTFQDLMKANGGQLSSPAGNLGQWNPGPTYAGITPFPRIVPITETPPESQAIPKREKVALIGTAPSSRLLAPFEDLSWEIWVCSPGNMNSVPRVDVWFELHKNLLWPEYKSYGEPYIKWLAEQKFPIYMQDQEFVPNAMTFPMEEMVKEFGGDFFSSSFVWMMALAITKGFKEIGLFGIDMASRDEYILQRPGFYFFKREAEKRGIKVWAPRESDIMQSPGLYAYSEVTPFGRKLNTREFELKQRIAALDNEIRQIEEQLRQRKENKLYLSGALEDVDYMKAIHIRLGSEVSHA